MEALIALRSDRLGPQLVMVALFGCAASASAQPAPDYDFDWVTIGAVGNAPYTGDSPFGPPRAVGRGRVDYEYRMSRLEVTTGQWVEFVNTFTTQPDFPQELFGTFDNFTNGPHGWGATRDFSYAGPGERYVIPDTGENREMWPVSGIGWRDAALYCNWLHNGKSSDPASLWTGAYDTSTFGQTFDPFQVTDAAGHLPGAKFWIPTLDEWMKAAHYDPDRYGPGEGGWWDYAHSSDESPVSGLPGEGMTSAGIEWTSAFDPWTIPLGAYPEAVSPWGLLDTSGGTREWTEELLYVPQPVGRSLGGSFAGGPMSHMPDGQTLIINDHVSGFDGLSPLGSAFGAGLRIASTVPAPSTCTCLMIFAGICCRRRRRA